MSFVSHLHCIRCGAEYPADSIMNLCPVDDGPVEVIIDLARLQTEQPDLAWYHPERNDMWRFGGLLPLDINDSNDVPHIFNLGEVWLLGLQSGEIDDQFNREIRYRGGGCQVTTTHLRHSLRCVTKLSGMRTRPRPPLRTANHSI